MNKNTWTLTRYTQNLQVNDENVFSYNTKVAEINHTEKTVTKLGYWSVTTSKHINYVASEFGYEVTK